MVHADLICVPQLMSGEQALAAQIGGYSRCSYRHSITHREQCRPSRQLRQRRRWMRSRPAARSDPRSRIRTVQRKGVQ